MCVMQAFFDFIEDEDGAVTVDWVVLAAAVIGMGMLVLNPIAFQTESMADKVGTDIMNVPVGYGNY
jgi:Flp pilus assembly pilin Flp